MSTIKEKQNQLQDVETVRFISSTLLEVSARRMMELREALAENRKFYEEIGELYAVVKGSAVQHGHAPRANSGGLSGKQTTVAVVLTSNKRFQGSLNRDLVKSVLLDISSTPMDCIVVGKTGKEIADANRNMPACQFLLFEHDEPAVAEVQEFLKKVLVYQKIFVYYPTFSSVFLQKVRMIR